MPRSPAGSPAVDAIYEPEYSQAALDALLFASRRRRDLARATVEQICRLLPDGDFQVRDANGRDWSVVLLDGVIVTYWIDHAVSAVKLGLIEWA